MAIIPLQMKLIYRIGKSYGFELDSGSVKDFLATAGVGLTSQYLEQAGRKLLGGLLGAIGGRLLGGVGRQAVSSGMSFASTYALGQVARRYYAANRNLSADMLKRSPLKEHTPSFLKQKIPLRHRQTRRGCSGSIVRSIPAPVRRQVNSLPIGAEPNCPEWIFRRIFFARQP